MRRAGHGGRGQCSYKKGLEAFALFLTGLSAWRTGPTSTGVLTFKPTQGPHQRLGDPVCLLHQQHRCPASASGAKRVSHHCHLLL